MIKIDFSLAVALYLILTTCIALLLLVLKNNKEPEKFSSEKNFLWQCYICAYAYIDSRHADISKCPRCGSYNSKEKKTDVAGNR